MTISNRGKMKSRFRLSIIYCESVALVVILLFDDAGAFDRGLALVSGDVGYIDHAGKYVWREE